MTRETIMRTPGDFLLLKLSLGFLNLVFVQAPTDIVLQIVQHHFSDHEVGRPDVPCGIRH